MSAEMNVLDTNVGPLDRVTFADTGRIEYEGGRLRCLWPADSETSEYVISVFQYDGQRDSVELPDGAVVLSVESSVIAAVPLSAYGGGA